MEVIKTRTNEAGIGVGACMSQSTYRLFWSSEFRPLQTEEEKAVERMMEYYEEEFTTQGAVVAEKLCRKLYQAGFQQIRTCDPLGCND